MTKSSGQDAPKGNVGKPLPIRLKEDQRRELDAAAEVTGELVSAFIRRVALAEARRVLRSLRYR